MKMHLAYNGTKIRSRGNIKKKEKIFSTTEEQAAKLVNENGLDIPDIADAKKKLLYYTNFDLINGYRAPFLNKDYVSDEDPYAEHDTKIFVPGASFDEIYALYEFNSNIRALLLKYIIILETDM